MNQYTALAKFYDRLNSEVDYKTWAKFIDTMINKHHQMKTNLVLDLACGSGNMTIEMAKLGYDMIGVDLSIDMLMEARRKSNGYDILYLNQDMRDFELYGTVDTVICCLDSINYLLSESDVKKCFSLVYNYLNPSGLFFFDVNTPYKFNNVYADNTYVFEIEEDDIFCTWQNSFDCETNICDFYLNIFAANDDGTYNRYQEQQSECLYTQLKLQELLTDTGFDVIDIVSDFKCNSLRECDERWYFICKSKKV